MTNIPEILVEILTFFIVYSKFESFVIFCKIHGKFKTVAFVQYLGENHQ